MSQYADVRRRLAELREERDRRERKERAKLPPRNAPSPEAKAKLAEIRERVKGAK